MAELLVIGYPDVETAQKSLDTVQQLEKDLIMQTGGAAVVKKTDEGKVEMVTKTGATSAGAAMGGFWGLLFGLLFLIPVGGQTIQPNAKRPNNGRIKFGTLLVAFFFFDGVEHAFYRQKAIDGRRIGLDPARDIIGQVQDLIQHMRVDGELGLSRRSG